MKETRHCSACGTALTADWVEPVCLACKSPSTVAGSPGTTTHRESNDATTQRPGIEDETETPTRTPRMGGDGHAERRPATLQRIGDYEVLGELSHGGMGVVYRARQISLNRPVALKMILAGRFANTEAIQRFRVEAEAAAQLTHPNIVPIYEVGEDEGRHYFSMRLLEGGSLSRHVERLGTDLRAAASLMAKVARAVHHAHQHGILHRDLKPGNILLDEQGEPFVTDFGLAKFVQSDSQLTRSEAVMGTPAYMAPEQAGGRSRQATTAADVYSLGAVLYLLMTQRVPFEAENVFQTLRLVVEQEPARPSTLCPHLDADLETIALKCLEKNPAHRYATAEALAEELERWVRNEPITARPSTTWERTVKWCRRKPVVAGLTAAVALVAVLGTTGVIWKWRDAVAGWNEAEGKAREARIARQQAQQQADTSALLHAEELILVIDSAPRAVAVLAQLLRRNPTNRIAADALLLTLAHRNFVLPSFDPVQQPGLLLAQVLPDGQRFLTATRDGDLCVWSAADGAQLRHYALQTGLLSAAALSPDAQHLAVAVSNHIHFVQVPDGRVSAPFSFGVTLTNLPPARVQLLQFSPDSRSLTIVTMQGRVHRMQIATGAHLPVPAHFPQPAESIQFSDDSSLILVRRRTDMILFSQSSTSLAGVFPSPTQRLGGILDAAISPDGRLVAVAQAPDRVQLLQISSNGLVPGRLLKHSSVTALQFAQGGSSLLTLGDDRILRRWTMQDASLQPAMLRLQHQPRHLILDRAGMRVALVSAAGEIRAWDVASLEPLCESFYLGEQFTSLQFHPGGSAILTVSGSDHVRTWPLGNGQPPGMRLHPMPGVVKSAWHPDGRHIIAGNTAGDLLHIEAGTGKATPLPAEHAAEITAIQFDATGRHAATGAKGGTLRLWRTQPVMEPVHSMQLTGNLVTLAFSPGSERLLAAQSDGLCLQWNVPDGTPVSTHIQAGAALLDAGFTTSGTSLLLLLPGSLETWDWRRGIRIASNAIRPGTRLHQSPVNPVRFLLDGVHTPNVRLWDAVRSPESATRFPHDERVWSAEPSGDGQWLATAANDRIVRLWRPAHDGVPFLSFEIPGISPGLAFDDRATRLLAFSMPNHLHLRALPSGRLLLDTRLHALQPSMAALSPRGDFIALQTQAGIGILPLRSAAIPVSAAFLNDIESLASRSLDAGGIERRCEPASARTLQSPDTTSRWTPPERAWMQDFLQSRPQPAQAQGATFQ